MLGDERDEVARRGCRRRNVQGDVDRSGRPGGEDRPAQRDDQPGIRRGRATGWCGRSLLAHVRVMPGIAGSQPAPQVRLRRRARRRRPSARASSSGSGRPARRAVEVRPDQHLDHGLGVGVRRDLALVARQLEHRLHLAPGRVDDALAERLEDLGMLAPLEIERRGDPDAVVRADALVEPAQELDQRRSRVGARSWLLRLGHLADRGGHHVGLRRIPPVDRRPRDARLGGDGLDRRAVVALAAQEPQRRRDDLAIGGDVPGPSGWPAGW